MPITWRKIKSTIQGGAEVESWIIKQNRIPVAEVFSLEELDKKIRELRKERNETNNKN